VRVHHDEGWKGQPVRQAQGILLPDPLPESIPFYQVIHADASGKFISHGVPPGNYKLYFREGIEPSQFFDRDLLRQAGGKETTVRVEKGSRATVTVPILVP
jgi:hypothetical protein